jgi:DNA segregation ATPase FtsK/SpoIIIE-like protein
MKKDSAEKPKKQDDRVEKFVQPLKVDLTEKELIEKGAQMAQAQDEAEKQTAEAKNIASQYKSKIDALKLQISTLAGLVRSKSEFRPVDCERRFVFERGVVEEVRMDTKAVVNVRQMTFQEKQPDLPLDGMTQKPAAAAGDAGSGSPAASSATTEGGESGDGKKSAAMVGEEIVTSALHLICETKRVSMSMLQRRLKLGMAMTDKLMFVLEERGYVGPAKGKEPREIKFDMDAWLSLNAKA